MSLERLRTQCAVMFAVGMMSVVDTAVAADAEGGERCFDAAVIVRLVRQEDRGLIDDPSDLIGRSEFGLTFKVKQTLYSRVQVPRGSFTVAMAAHGAMRSDIKDLLVFLRREHKGFSARWFEVYITRDERGRWIRPLPHEFLEGPSDSELFPQFWIPRDFVPHLVQLRYRVRDAWWQQQVFDEDGKLIPPSARPAVVEEKGFVLGEMLDYLASLADQPCQ